MSKIGLVNILKEQSGFGFTGRLNILLGKSGQYLGVILLSNGLIVYSVYSGAIGKKALYKILVDDYEPERDLTFVVEPEVVIPDQLTYSLSFQDFEIKAKSIIENFTKAKSLEPPGHLKILAIGHFAKQGPEIDDSEFNVLALLSDFHIVSDIYKHSDLLHHEVTIALVGLRNKGAIKVLKN